MSEVLMPKLSDSMEAGAILTWLKSSGDQVEIGDELLEIETDKATVTYAAEDGGALEILVEEGITVAVGTSIARIGDARGLAAADTADMADRADKADKADREMDSETASARGTDPAPAAAGNGHAAATLHATAGSDRPSRHGRATPIASRAAAAHGVALDQVDGTGPLGRITRADVLKHAGLVPDNAPALPSLRSTPAAPAFTAAPQTQTQAQTGPGTRRQSLTRLQQLIARRMVEAKATVPHFQVQTEVVMDAAVALRNELKALEVADETLPSLNDLIVKAAASALTEFPLANGSFLDDAFILHDQVNVGIAVSTDDGLVVPTVFDTASKSLGEIAREARRLAARVRDGEISPAELEGGTFTVSNLGMFGMTAIAPVINSPQAAILGVGALRQTLARGDDDQVVDRALLTLTLSCDHRILYGAEAARFLSRIGDLLERPLRLLL
jgi:pyruvate dehydrogenase E2 component (dihydrolipoamide acetyltransferase)